VTFVGFCFNLLVFPKNDYEVDDVPTKSTAVLKRLIGLRPSVIKVDLIPRA
jgi:hypothetical protein